MSRSTPASGLPRALTLAAWSFPGTIFAAVALFVANHLWGAIGIVAALAAIIAYAGLIVVVARRRIAARGSRSFSESITLRVAIGDRQRSKLDTAPPAGAAKTVLPQEHPLGVLNGMGAIRAVSRRPLSRHRPWRSERQAVSGFESLRGCCDARVRTA